MSGANQVGPGAPEISAAFVAGTLRSMKCDPDVQSWVESVVGGLEPTRSAWSEVAAGAGASVVGSATKLTLGQGALRSAQWPSPYR